MRRASICLSALLYLASTGAFSSQDTWTSQLRLGGWSHHLEDEPYESSPRFNESHKGIGYYYRINQCHGSVSWYCKVGVGYLRDSFDNPMYIASWNWQYAFNEHISAGLLLGVGSRTVARYGDEVFLGTERKVVPLLAPNMEITWGRFSIGFAVLPHVDYRVEDGKNQYDLQKPTLFWDIGISF
ncbi:hypothetical protein [Ferrimonas pelagia]|uniref:Acyloxyacyl hydrolase n=1 Tax=Ferrimonas pelagia TaxID=1177826 RepID=A0ABP9EJW4_9GAMM